METETETVLTAARYLDLMVEVRDRLLNMAERRAEAATA